MKPSQRGASAQPRRAATGSPDRLRQAFDSWLALPPWCHALAVALLCLLGLVWFRISLTAPAHLTDEAFYELAFQAVQEGRSPYQVRGYYYPAAFAFFGGWLDGLIGTEAIRYGLRGLNLLALVGTLWLSAAWWSGPRRGAHSPDSHWLERLGVAALLLVVSPGIAIGIHLGNLSFLAIGLAIAGWTTAGRYPALAGLAIASSLALKPIAAAALPLLVLTPPEDRARRHRIAGLVGGMATAVIWLAFPYFSELLGQELERIGRLRTWSVRRLIEVLGVDIGHLGIFVGSTLLAILICWRFPRIRATRAGWLAFASASCVLTTPLIWGHTLVLFFPVLVMAATVTINRWRSGRIAQPAWAEPTFVALGCANLLYFNPGAIDRLAVPIEAFFLLSPVTAVALLTAHVCRDGDTDRRSRATAFASPPRDDSRAR